MHHTNHIRTLLELAPLELEVLVQSLLRLGRIVLRVEGPVVQDWPEAHAGDSRWARVATERCGDRDGDLLQVRKRVLRER